MKSTFGMDAPLNSLTSYRVDLDDDPLSRIARRTVALGTALVLLLSVVVLTRGVAGAFDAPASSAFIVVAAIIAVLLASGIRAVWTRLNPDAPRNIVLISRLGIPFCCLTCIAIAMSMTDASSWAIGSIWLIVLGNEFVWWSPEFRSPRSLATPSSPVTTVNTELSNAVEDDEDAAEFDPNVTQQITRSRNDAGMEVLSGVLRAEFLPGERTHNLHVAFCPPLAYDPQVAAHQLEGLPLTIKVAQSEIYGTRIELRLVDAAGPSESATIYFEVQPT